MKIAKKQQKKKDVPYVAIGAAAIIVIVVLVIVLQPGGKDYTAFASCLAEEGYVMAGTEWCPHCKEQKSRFNGAFEEVIIPAGGYVDCDRQMQWCRDNNVTGYPTWITPEGNHIAGTQELSTLARISGCDL